MGRRRWPGTWGPERQGGFTLVELMVVLSLVALISGLVAISARPSPQQQLAREGERLALWLEAVRSQSRGLGRAVQVRVDPTGARTLDGAPDSLKGERLDWLYSDTWPVAVTTLTLGPEPILPSQQLELSQREGRGRVRVGTRGLGPWTAQ